MAVLYFVVIAAVIAAAYHFGHQAKQNRRAALLAVATKAGLQFSNVDPFGLVNLPFDVFGKGDRRGVENVIYGARDGVNVWLFDYWYRVQSGRSSTYYRFTCAISEIPADCPHLTLHREGFLSHLADHLGSPDISFESDEFNRAFEVHCSDEKFAFALIDGRMMEWLMQAAREVHLETGGPLVVITMNQLMPEYWPSLLEWEQDFRGLVPNAVYAMYKPA